jgi:hypothetical protein
MQKLIRVTMAALMLAGSSIGLVGCGEEKESSVKTETTAKGPGGTVTSTEKQTVTVKKTGENPPAIPGDSKAP